MTHHGDSELLQRAARAVLDGVEQLETRIELCKECFYMTLIATLLRPLYESKAMTEDELMTELQTILSALRNASKDTEPESRVLH